MDDSFKDIFLNDIYIWDIFLQSFMFMLWGNGN